MSTITMWFRKTLLVGLVAVLGLVSAPLANVYALGQFDTGTPPTPTQTTTPTDRLQRAFSREQTIYGKLGKLLNNAGTRISKFQNLINKAKTNGKDVSNLQSALDAFSSAVTQAQSIYNDAQSLIASHPGFDASGNVTDQTTALQTVRDLRGKLREIRQTVLPPFRALRQEIRAYREENSPNNVMPAPTQSGG
ncbi:MAG: hypothetical protein M1282_15980 [Chloroflexi bacterium]|nr:hypothetical protein [Chloroflexota bacterium]